MPFHRLAACPLLLLACAGAPAIAADAAPPLDDSARSQIALRLQNGEVASMVVAVIDGKQSAVYGFGKAGAQAPDGDTVYEIGSISKTMTALLLAQAVQQGQLQLDQPVSALLPAYTVPAFDGQAITLRDLATQTSGLPRLPANLAPQRPDNPYAGYTAADLRTFLAGYRLTRKPGAVYEYSNLGYGLLGVALAGQAGKPYGELVRERIAAPLGMRDTAIALTPALRARLAPGTTAAGQPAANWDFDAIAGAGAVRSTAHDMVRYVGAMMEAKDGYGLVQQPQRPVGNGMRIALGWHLSDVRGTPVVWHNGGTGGYASFAGFSADGRRGVVVLSNRAIPVDAIAMAALVPGAPPAQTAVTLTAEALAAYNGRYELAPGFVLSVAAAEQGLRVQATGQPPFPARASALDAFFLTAVDARLTFRRNAAGQVDGVVLHQNGRETPGKKIE